MTPAQVAEAQPVPPLPGQLDLQHLPRAAPLRGKQLDLFADHDPETTQRPDAPVCVGYRCKAPATRSLVFAVDLLHRRWWDRTGGLGRHPLWFVGAGVCDTDHPTSDYLHPGQVIHHTTLTPPTLGSTR